ncbi:MAG: four helix bundle protein [Ignavibacteriae bacterium]|nr:four helix bundle protein [Ignavibacteriota bacterium]
MHDYKKLRLWQQSIELVKEIYKLTKNFPSEEKFGLTNQIRRSAVSVPSNIAEGAGRNTKGEFKNFLGVANGSLFELETQLIISKDMNYLKDYNLNLLLPKIDMLQKMIYNLIKSVNNN